MKEYLLSPPDATRITQRLSDRCSRCRRPAPVRGRFTATIEGGKRFICATCCSEIGSVAALVRHAEASERELERRRFTERRPADRREAA